MMDGKFRDDDGEEGVSEPHGGISLDLSLDFQQVSSQGGGKGMLSTFQLWQEPGFASEEVREIAPGCAQTWKAGKKSCLTALASGDLESSSAVLLTNGHDLSGSAPWFPLQQNGVFTQDACSPRAESP